MEITTFSTYNKVGYEAIVGPKDLSLPFMNISEMASQYYHFGWGFLYAFAKK